MTPLSAPRRLGLALTLALWWWPGLGPVEPITDAGPVYAYVCAPRLALALWPGLGLWHDSCNAPDRASIVVKL